jgi:hypothetical protein
MPHTENNKSGYIYILQNDAYDPFFIKIGLTRHTPDKRAKEIYWGATGVPLKFNIAIAFSVSDCVLAEKEIHSRLNTFRINSRREFFKIRPDIAAAITLETCCNINKDMGFKEPEEFHFIKENQSIFLEEIPDIFRMNKDDEIISIEKISDIKVKDSGESILTTEQIDRIRIIHAILRSVFEITLEEAIESFTKDQNLEKEIIIWENMAKVFQSFEVLPGYSELQKEEAFKLILMRSSQSESCTKDAIGSYSLGEEAIEFILSKYRPGSM